MIVDDLVPYAAESSRGTLEVGGCDGKSMEQRSREAGTRQPATPMTSEMPDRDALESAVSLACRAPSLHNSQPWRWVIGGFGLQLFSDPDRLLPATDAFGRQMVFSCGAALNHLHYAFAAMGWECTIDRMPPRADRDLLASIGLFRRHDASPADARMADAIGRRRTDRLPFAVPPSWVEVVPQLKAVAAEFGTDLEVLGERSRSALEEASLRLTGYQGADPMYQAELRWWTRHTNSRDGVPEEALPTESQRRSVSLARGFPSGSAESTDTSIEQDRSAIVLLTSAADSRLDWLRAGESLSAILLECTSRGLATCSVTHLTEMPGTRTLVRELSSGNGLPQVLIRVGVVTDSVVPPQTPRRPLSEVLFHDRPARSQR
ncbi:Acg family FMN-binding oxidoreductase [Rhodococcus jostii]|nr:hypothetical protein [Rhodococcus jostii]